MTCSAGHDLQVLGAGRAWSGPFLAAAALLTPEVLLRVLSATHALCLDDAYATVSALLATRCSPDGDLGPLAGSTGCAGSGTAAAQALCELLPAIAALETLQESDGASAVLEHAAAALTAATHHVGQLVNVVEDSVLRLWRATRPLVDGVASGGDKAAPLVTTVLAAVHAAAEAVNLDDDLLRCVSRCIRIRRCLPGCTFSAALSRCTKRFATCAHRDMQCVGASEH